MRKDANEITVRLLIPSREAIERLSAQGFTLERTRLITDTYYLPKDADLHEDPLVLLERAVILRDFGDFLKLTVKHKEYAPNGDILAQSGTDLRITDKAEAAAFLEALGYRPVMVIRDHVTVLEKDGLGFALEEVEGTPPVLYLEIEENEKYQGIDALKARLRSSGLPYDESDYFCKKAKDALLSVRS